MLFTFKRSETFSSLAVFCQLKSERHRTAMVQVRSSFIARLCLRQIKKEKKRKEAKHFSGTVKFQLRPVGSDPEGAVQRIPVLFKSLCFFEWILPFHGTLKTFCERAVCSSYEKQGRKLLSLLDAIGRLVYYAGPKGRFIFFLSHFWGGQVFFCIKGQRKVWLRQSKWSSVAESFQK